MRGQQLSDTFHQATGAPASLDITRSRKNIDERFEQTASPIWWDAIESPIGVLHLAAGPHGLCRVDLHGDQARFLAHLDPLARTEHNPKAMGQISTQIAEYFARQRQAFDLPIDLEHVAPFQRRVLQMAITIPSGTVWTYRQVAAAISNPKASRAVGQALGRNPIPIIVPCHRVIGSNGNLRGYAGGLDRKRMLLELEGAL
ncbi:MAG: methylated-DNA--[protein]-cysteine S-methyltransferase [Anaerolineae bacterium]|nr:methylated-DNA--[protein]-cysteine S-methyltransferase [Anaerolineae bacterium]